MVKVNSDIDSGWQNQGSFLEAFLKVPLADGLTVVYNINILPCPGNVNGLDWF